MNVGRFIQEGTILQSEPFIPMYDALIPKDDEDDDDEEEENDENLGNMPNIIHPGGNFYAKEIIGDE